jgi:hypothetical protein
MVPSRFVAVSGGVHGGIQQQRLTRTDLRSWRNDGDGTIVGSEGFARHAARSEPARNGGEYGAIVVAAGATGIRTSSRSRSISERASAASSAHGSVCAVTPPATE